MASTTSANPKSFQETSVTLETGSETQKLIKIAEFEAKRAEYQAETAEALSGHVRMTVEALDYRAKFHADTIKTLSQQAATEPEVRAKYQATEAITTEAKRKALNKKSEAKLAEIKSNEIILANRAEAKRAKEAKEAKAAYEIKAAAIAAQKAKAKALELEAEAKELEAEARKAAIEAKKAKLELKQVKTAGESIAKHTAELVNAQAKMEIKKDEFDNREAEAKARRAQAKARKAEVKALKARDLAGAEDQRVKARVHRAEAIARHEEIREKKAKPKLKKAPEKPQPLAGHIGQRQARLVEKKHVSAKGLLNIVNETFQEIPDKTTGTRKSEITLRECLMSGLAIFGLKYPSLLQFNDDSREGGCICNNLKTLYNVNHTPSDTYMRERLDGVNPHDIRPAFKNIFAQFQRGKELEKYRFLDEYFLVSGDGTGFFSSKTIHCDDCCIKEHKDGSKSYYHQMMSAVIVHPDLPTVIPFCPEPIINGDGSEKNDCERNASERLYRCIRREHPHLNIIITEDAIASNGPHIRLLEELNMRYIVVVKPDGNKFLFEHLKGINLEECTHKDGEYTYKIRFINGIPLNGSNLDINVNFFEIYEFDKDGNQTYHNSWITDIRITIHNVYHLCQGGRVKWKIENETFNTLKNQGYHFEHNFGHGFKYLSTIFALLMFLAFTIDQMQQSSCGLFQAALTKMGSRARLWRRMQAYFTTLYIDSWEQLLQGIAFGIEEGRLTPKKKPLDTS